MRRYHCSRTEQLSTSVMATVPEFIHGPMATPIKIPAGSLVFAEIGTLILKVACRGTFGGRRKAVRDRLALQGGTGDFP